MIEKEIRGFIEKGEFEFTIEKFTALLGSPKISKRVSLAIADYDNLTLETKIRITNGKVEIVQKVGEFTATDRQEITIKLENLNSKALVDLFRTYKNFLKDKKNPMLTLIQHENYVFNNDRFEVKLFRQFGNDEFFAFEVEALIEMEDSELEKFCKENGLIVDPLYNSYDSIQERNSKVNINLEDIDPKELESILDKYLN
ncbi:MAG: hypothetical protein KatS3mg085_516 [Candidatus Dojkabacteria bacterium]|nr:MAG: hypothetical protein KatS3mg085_516 [Candidatus Dojkabacteria bacterium]